MLKKKKTPLIIIEQQLAFKTKIMLVFDANYSKPKSKH